MSNRDARGRFVTKGIAETVASVGSAKETEASSLVGRSAMFKSLSPRQAYENNIHARKAVSTKANDIAKAKARLFTQNGDEVESGDAYDFIRRFLNPDAIRSLASWLNVEGEMATWLIPGGLRPSGLRVLDPAQLMHLPYHVRRLDFVQTWDYYDGYAIDGIRPSINLPAEQVHFASNWNPNHPFRGLAPALTGITEISTNYYAGRYNAAFFQNGAHKDIIIRFPKGTDKDVARDWIKKWDAQHSIFNGSAFKISGVIGDDMEVIEPGQTNRDGQFLQLREANANDIMALWGVPAILFDANRAKYDSADAQLEMYFENTLLPDLTCISTYVQAIIDRYFPSSAGTQKKTVKLLGHSKKAYERQQSVTRSDLVFMLDPDSLPIAAKLRMQQLDSADKYRRTMAVGFAAAAEWAGIDREENEADDLIYVALDQQRVGEPEPQEPAQDTTLQDEVKALKAQLEEATAAKTLDEAQKQQLDVLKKFGKEYRQLVVTNAALGRFDKQAAVKLLADHKLSEHDGLKLQVAADHLAVRAILKGDADEQVKLRLVKDLMNAATKPANLKQFLRGN